MRLSPRRPTEATSESGKALAIPLTVAQTAQTAERPSPSRFLRLLHVRQPLRADGPRPMLASAHWRRALELARVPRRHPMEVEGYPAGGEVVIFAHVCVGRPHWRAGRAFSVRVRGRLLRSRPDFPPTTPPRPTSDRPALGIPRSQCSRPHRRYDARQAEAIAPAALSSWAPDRFCTRQR